MIFIETSSFTKHISKFLDDDEYSGLQGFLLLRPDAGKVVRGSGGVRKLRWLLQVKAKAVAYASSTIGRVRMMKSGC